VPTKFSQEDKDIIYKGRRADCMPLLILSGPSTSGTQSLSLSLSHTHTHTHTQSTSTYVNIRSLRKVSSDTPFGFCQSPLRQFTSLALSALLSLLLKPTLSPSQNHCLPPLNLPEQRVLWKGRTRRGPTGISSHIKGQQSQEGEDFCHTCTI
jgi:hypothetical protein